MLKFSVVVCLGQFMSGESRTYVTVAFSGPFEGVVLD